MKEEAERGEFAFSKIDFLILCCSFRYVLFTTNNRSLGEVELRRAINIFGGAVDMARNYSFVS